MTKEIVVTFLHRNLRTVCTYIYGTAKIAKCLHGLTSKETKWNWSDECDHAFHTLKEKLVSAPILGNPDPKTGQFILDTYASNGAFGCVLYYIQENCERVIAYGS